MKQNTDIRISQLIYFIVFAFNLTMMVSLMVIMVFLSIGCIPSTFSQGNLKCTTDLIMEYEAIKDLWWNRSYMIPHINHKNYIRMLAEFVSKNDSKQEGPKDIGKTTGLYLFQKQQKRGISSF